MTFPLPFNAADRVQLEASLQEIGYTATVLFEKIQRVWARVEAARADGTLAGPPFGYTAEQIAYLDRLVSDMHSLRQLAYGEADQQGPYNFMDAIGRETGFR